MSSTSSTSEARKLADSIWLILIARMSMAITPVLFTLAWAVGSSWVQRVETSIAGAFRKAETIQSHVTAVASAVDVLAQTVTIHVDQNNQTRAEMLKRVERLEERVFTAR